MSDVKIKIPSLNKSSYLQETRALRMIRGIVEHLIEGIQYILLPPKVNKCVHATQIFDSSFQLTSLRSEISLKV